ncbi:MAG: hypothetical protein M3R68_00745, partial [Acidobacteriota bacterium]|nr:hypothetical protein [Acidobacteriota bacterium]
LPGIFLLSAAVDTSAVAPTLEGARRVLKSLVDSPVSASELEKAKSDISPLGPLAQSDALANAWLDIEAYALPSISEQMRAWNSLTPADLQRVAARLFGETAIATVVVGNAETLKDKLSPDVKIEVLGEVKPKALESTTTVEPPKKRTPAVLPPPRNTNPLMKSTKPPTKP